MKLVKAHAFGNDFLLVREEEVPAGADRPALARDLCARHRGIGADGLIAYQTSGFAPCASERGFGETAALRAAARMDLLNADGSYSEVSGNGLRCLAAWLAREGGVPPGGSIDVETDAGVKRLELLAVDGRHFTFRAAMGPPEHVQRRSIDVDGVAIEAVTLRVGNPQCVVLGEVTEARLHAIAAKLAVHPIFPEGSNVELAQVERPAACGSDLGAGCRADRGVGDRRLRRGRRRDRVWRSRARRGGRCPRRRPARRVDRRGPLPYGLGGGPFRGAVVLAFPRDA